ncbi:HNH endonuclease [Intestinibaculum porci]
MLLRLLTNDESNLISLCRSCHEKIYRERGDR